MRLGIFAKTFSSTSLDRALDGVVASGLTSTQFNFSLAVPPKPGMSLPVSLPRALTGRILDEVRRRRLEIVAVSGTYNMAHPEIPARRAGLQGLEAVIAAAPAIGTRVVTLCTGTRHKRDMWQWHSDNATRQAWQDMATSVAAAAKVAAAHGVIIAFEPERGNIVADAPSARRLLDEVDSAQIKVVLDAANLIQPGELARQASTMEQAIELLGDDLALVHAKDMLDDGTVVAPGRGGLDFGRYLSFLDQAGYGGPVVLHGLDEGEVKESVAFVRSHLERTR